jgi:hypothetical protein
MSYDYDDLNLTELEVLARQHGSLAAHRGLGRELLIDLIEGRFDPGELPPDPADDEREAMMHMKDEWPEVYNQLKCSDEHYACWDCPAARAVACAIEECEPDIRRRVKEGDLE